MLRDTKLSGLIRREVEATSSSSLLFIVILNLTFLRVILWLTLVDLLLNESIKEAQAKIKVLELDLALS